MRSLRPLAGSLLFACAIPHTPLLGQQLVADIVPQAASTPASAPTAFVPIGPRAVFFAGTSDSGLEPWATDGTAAGTYRIRDLVPGIGSAGLVRVYCEHQGRALFSAVLPGSDVALFLTDGTPGNVQELGTLGLSSNTQNLGPGIRNVQKLANGTLLVSHGVNGRDSIYATDLTVAGTHLLPGLVTFVPEIAVGNVTYGSSLDALGQYEIWATDGTAAGTRQVATGLGTTRPQHFTAWNGRLYFQQFDNTTVCWLASTDGNQGFVRHTLLANIVVAPLAGPMFVANNRLVMLLGGGLYTSDGTTAGTGLVPNLPCANLRELTQFGGRLYMSGENAAFGNELWTTDGTTAGTTLVADLVPGANGSHPEQLLATSQELYWAGTAPTGRSLLRLTGTSTLQILGGLPTGTPRRWTLPSGGYASTGLVAFQGGILFGGPSANSGDEPWFASPTQAPAVVLDINTGQAGFPLAMPAPARDRLFFLGTETVHGYEAWSTNGQPGGTVAFDTLPGVASELNISTSNITALGNRLAIATTRRLAVTDGTAAGTVTLRGGAPVEACKKVKTVGDELYFLANGLLYRSDGTVAGTTLVPASSSRVAVDYDVLPGGLVLSAWDEVFPTLLVTDGVSTPVAIDPSQVHRLGIVGDRLIFQRGYPSYEVKATDGTLAGTTTLFPATLGALAFAGNARDGYFLHGTEIVRTDGTAAGTQVVATLPSGMADCTLVPTANELFAVGATPATGRELWQLDRTTHQLRLVIDLAPGIYSGTAEAAAIGTGDLVFVAGGVEPFGVEPYVSDGTVAGTRRLADLHPGAASSNPHWLAIADTTAYFLADDGTHGRELWSIPVSALGGANVQSFGSPCPGSAGLPHLAANDVPSPGTQNFVGRLTGLRSLAPALLGIATDHAAGNLGGCELSIGGSIASLLGFSNLFGSVAFPMPLPNSATLVGYRFALQGFGLDALTPRGFAGSNGAIVVIGR